MRDAAVALLCVLVRGTEKSAGEGLHEFGALNTLLFVRGDAANGRVTPSLNLRHVCGVRAGHHPGPLHRVRVPDQGVPLLLLARVWRRGARRAHRGRLVSAFARTGACGLDW